MYNPLKASSPGDTGELLDREPSTAKVDPILPQKTALRNMNVPEPPKFSDGYIDHFLRRRVCARCYGDLVSRPAPDRFHYAVCPVCEDAWHYATISRYTAEMRGQKARSEYIELRYFSPWLRDLFPPMPQRIEAEIIAKLGFA